LRSLSISTILFPPADVFQIGKGIRYWKKNRGPFFPVPAQHRDDPGPIQHAKPARTVCFLVTLPSGPQRFTDPTRQPHSFTGGNHYAPTRYGAWYPPKPVRFLCSSFAPLAGTIPVDQPPSIHAPALPC
jgi:hypothetical protein